MAEIVMDGVTKVYGDDTVAVNELDLHVEDGEFVVLVGPSGCGKSTALRMVAGLEKATRGEIRIGDRVVNDLAPKDRDIAMVFQGYALYPHLSVYDNMAFGLKLAKMKKDEIDGRVKQGARVLGLEELLDRKPRHLSGGQRQRVAMGRAIVREPRAFLMDEPLSNLDAKLRVHMRSEIARIQKDLDVTTIYVTHDQVEAMTMGNRVAVLKKGELQQVAPPPELFAHPRSLFVAGFIGSPSMNFVSSTLQRSDGRLRVRIGEQPIEVPDDILHSRPDMQKHIGGEIILGVRPQDFEDASLRPGVPRASRIKARINLVEVLGAETLVHFDVDAKVPVTDDMKELAEDVGGEQAEQLERRAKEGRNQFVAQLNPKSKVRPNDLVELAVDTSNLHFFDPETSDTIHGG